MANAIRKRIALASAVALTAGLVAAVPAQAAAATPFKVTAAESKSTAIGAATITATQIAGANNFVGFEAEDNLTAPGGSDEVRAVVTVSGGSISSFTNAANATGTLSSSNTVLTYSSHTVFTTTAATFRVGTPSAGTITVTIARRLISASTGQSTDTTLQTITITVNAAGTVNVYNASKSTAFLGAGAGPATADATLAFPSTASNTVKANVTVTQKDANGTDLTSGFKGVAVSISGAGAISDGTGGPTGSYVAVTPTAAGHTFGVYSDGRSGKATITVTVNGVVFATKTLTFYGASATVSVTNKVPHIIDDQLTADVLEVLVVDANGTPVAGETLTVTFSPAASVASSSVSGVTTAEGKATISVTTAADVTGTVTATVKTSNDKSATGTFVITDNVIADLAWAFDKTSYAPGAKAVVTITAKDKNGVLLGKRGALALFSAISTSSGINASLPTSFDIAAGTAKFEFFMPLAAGDFVINATTVATATTFATALQAKAVSLSTKVVAPANPDLDAAKKAAEDAKAAVAAVQAQVTALATSVTQLIAALSTQIRYLRNIVDAILKRIR